ncbi:amino acid adenylation domain-containing protein, partial [Rheinheimera soli]
FSEMAVDDLAPALDNKSLAYVIYTSGSTGKPKGVLAKHLGVVRFLFDANFTEFGPGRRVSQTATISFDASILELWGALLNGSTLVLYPHRYLDPQEISQYVEEYQINMLFLTSGLFEQWISTKPSHKQLGWLFHGGDALAPKVYKQALALFPGVHISNCYGPSESTCCTTIYNVTNATDLDVPTVPIGTAVNHTSCYVFDETGKLCPLGVAGELYIGGAGLVRGYLNRPELTEERFVTNPYRQGETLYRSGDLVNWRTDGNLEFIGRVDNQVKVRGFRIELGEIEHQLHALSEVREAVVMAPYDDNNQRRLVAWITAQDGQSDRLLVESCRQQLQRLLPNYMVPQVIVVLEQLPLTVNGKVDRKALKAPRLEDMSHEHVAPRNEIEL